MVALAFTLAVVQQKSNRSVLDQILTGKSGSHSFRVEIHCSNFEPRGRRITWKKAGYNYYVHVNGRRTWFSDGASKPLPDPVRLLETRTAEVRRFDVVVDGRRWRVPESLTLTRVAPMPTVKRGCPRMANAWC